MRVAFMGTPDFAVPALQAIIDDRHDVVAVYTQPPRPKGRGQQVQKSPVHERADQFGLEVRTPRSLKKDPEAQAAFIALKADVAVVAAYGLLLPKTVLEAPVHGCLNIHASLLPRWRGASPIQHAIRTGDPESGITIMRMEEGLDTGPMIEKRAVALHDRTTAQSLHDELAGLGGVMIRHTLHRLTKNETLPGEEQDDSLSTYAPLLKKEDGRIDWTRGAREIDRQIRALTPWPGVWTATEDERRVKIVEAEVLDEVFTEPPGTLVDRLGHVACGGDTVLRLIRVQPENAKIMDMPAAMNGRYLHPDMIFS